MNKKQVKRLINPNTYIVCQVCKKRAKGQYEYRSIQYIKDYSPRHLSAICRECIYKELYGSKNYRKKMKERVIENE